MGSLVFSVVSRGRRDSCGTYNWIRTVVHWLDLFCKRVSDLSLVSRNPTLRSAKVVTNNEGRERLDSVRSIVAGRPRTPVTGLALCPIGSPEKTWVEVPRWKEWTGTSGSHLTLGARGS